MKPGIELRRRFIEQIGIGTMGEVWKVQEFFPGDKSPHFLALKISHRPMNTQEVAGELQGIRLALSLDLPGFIHICAVEDIFGRLGVLMELADCSLWHRAVRQSQLSTLQLIGHIKAISNSIDLLAPHEVVHGGITPNEMLICGEQIRLADFSLMHQVGRSFPSHSIINLLTWACMCPEMKKGTSSLQSDQYSLAVSYTMLRTLRLPYIHPMADDPPDLSGLERHEREVIGKAVSENPEQRFATCSEFASALEESVK